MGKKKSTVLGGQTMDYMLNKEEFIECIERLRTATDAVRDINHIIKITYISF